jgi:hypothetical protein
MRYWGPNIRIDGQLVGTPDPRRRNAIDPFITRRNRNAEQYEISTQDVLRRISWNFAGKTLLDAFTALSSGYVVIRPVTPEAVLRMGAQPVPALDAQLSDSGSHGVGSLSIIWYIPSDQTIHRHIYRADDALLHECVHALRQIRGLWREVDQPGWGNREELLATMLTNIYASSDGRDADMRGDHSVAFHHMDLTDEQFYQEYRDAILDFRMRMSDIYAPISSMQAGWNPLRVAERWWNSFRSP